MIDPKLLALAFSKTAPDALTKAGKAHLANLQAIDKAEDQIAQWKSNRAESQAAAELTEQALSDALTAWDPNAAAAVK